MLKTITGFWNDEPQRMLTTTISLGAWDEQDDLKDLDIFYYMDGNQASVGDIIAESFTITEIEDILC
jgi:hypothetical protein